MAKVETSLAAQPPHKKRPTTSAFARFINGKGFAYLSIAPTLILMAILVFYPLVVGIMYSFTNANGFNVERHIGVNIIPASYKFIGLQNYINIITSKFYSVSFMSLLWQTLLWVAGSVIFHFFFGMILALLLNRKIRFRGVYRALMMIPWAMPQYIAAFGWSFILNQNYGIINLTLKALSLPAIAWTLDPNWARFAVIMVNVWLGVPFYVVTLLGGLQSIPADLEDAAGIDGANAWQRFINVTLPLMRPVVSLVVLLDTIWTFNVFSVIYFITNGAPGGSSDTIISFAYENPIASQFFGLGATYGVIILVILLFFTVMYSRALRTQQGAY